MSFSILTILYTCSHVNVLRGSHEVLAASTSSVALVKQGEKVVEKFENWNRRSHFSVYDMELIKKKSITVLINFVIIEKVPKEKPCILWCYYPCSNYMVSGIGFLNYF